MKARVAGLAGAGLVVCCVAFASDSGSARLVNRMEAEASSYLRGHARDPVAWQPWGEEAFELAARLGRPLFVSIGFFSCHWCHVLQEESFADPGIAGVLNERYVPVLVDRDERPDVDAAYQAAIAELGGSGGWPLNVWLTPEREPFFGSQYLPPDDGERGFERGLRGLLDRLARAWSADPAAVRETAGRVAGAAVERMRPSPPADLPSPGEVATALARLLAAVDPSYGGVRGAPKFPLGLPLQWMLLEGGEEARTAVERTLDAIAAGGVHDAVAGGFFRYAVDRAWRRPHFEKLLGDQARLSDLYLEAGRSMGRPDFVAIGRETLDFVARELVLPGGGLAAAIDADSRSADGGLCEGCHATWTVGEIDDALGEDEAKALRSRFTIESLEGAGGRGTLVRDPGFVEDDPLVARALASLLARRNRRPAPALDERPVLVSSGLAIGAFARAARALDEPRYREIATRAASATLAARAGRRAGQDGAPESLDDLAALAAGLLDLYETTGEVRWFEAVLGIVRDIEAGFANPATGGYFLARADAQSPLARPGSADDGPLPSGASLQAMSLLRLACWTGDSRYRERAIEVIRASAPGLLSMPWARGDLALALRFLRSDPVEVALIAPRDLDELSALRAPLDAPGAPDHVLSMTTMAQRASDSGIVPLLEGKRAVGGAATAYVCRRHVCERPTSDPAELARQLAALDRP